MGSIEQAAGDTGERGVLCLVGEALAELLAARDVLISRHLPERDALVDHAGFTHSPESWDFVGHEYDLARFPATRAVLDSGRPYTTWAGDPDGDPAELGLLAQWRYDAELMLRLALPDRTFLVEAWRSVGGRPFATPDVERAGRLVELAAPLVTAAIERDRAEERRFSEVVRLAADLGPADRELAELAVAVAEAMRLSEPLLREARLVALVHDIGKRSIPAALMEKQGPLTPAEWAVMQRQTIAGQRMLERMPHLYSAVDSVGAVRERWDGSGYPRGLAGAEIPLVARIVHVCSAYRAMLSDRPGRPARSHEQAVDELREGAGAQFDPMVVRAATAVLQPGGAAPVVRLRSSTI